MRQAIIEALQAHAKGHIEKHKANVEVQLQKPVGVAEHPDTLETIEKMKQPKTIEHKKKISKSITNWWEDRKQQEVDYGFNRQQTTKS